MKRDLDSDSILDLARGGENQKVVFHSPSAGDAHLERTALAMANTEGGILLVGVSAGGILGVGNKYQSGFEQTIAELRSLYPALGLQDKWVSFGQADILAIEVERSSVPILDLSGRLWLRPNTEIRHALGGEVRPGSVDFQTQRSNQRLPFGALRAALREINPTCAFPGCAIDDPLEVAALSSIDSRGPRFDPSLAEHNRTSLDNFLLLCPNHHVIVDRDPASHTLEWMNEVQRVWAASRDGSVVAASEDPPSCFLSYSWESDEHVEWVAKLAADLQSEMGVSVVLDSWSLRPGDSITQFMERAVEDCDFVAMVLTPSYANRVSTREGGVGYEGGLVTGDMLAGRDPRRSVPILRGDAGDSVPAFLKGKMYIDFRDEYSYEHALEELGRAIHNAPRVVPPKVGTPPWRRKTAV